MYRRMTLNPWLVMALACTLATGCSDSSTSDNPSDGGLDGSQADARPGDASSPDSATDATSGANWAHIPPGTFMMGSPESEPCRGHSEDQHEVTLTRAFEMQRTEVTKEAFELQMGYDPSTYTQAMCGGDCPVERVSWYEAAAYCNGFSTEAGLTECYTCTGSEDTLRCDAASEFEGQAIYACPGFRLPTEAEWEYAYRAGTTTAYYSGVKDGNVCEGCANDPNADAIGWYCANYDNAPLHRVGQKQANAWGLHDMAGNVSEWTHDNWKAYLGTDPVTDPAGEYGHNNWTLRGGSWGTSSSALRASWRMGAVRTTSLDNLGFRCARTLTP